MQTCSSSYCEPWFSGTLLAVAGRLLMSQQGPRRCLLGFRRCFPRPGLPTPGPAQLGCSSSAQLAPGEGRREAAPASGGHAVFSNNLHSRWLLVACRSSTCAWWLSQESPLPWPLRLASTRKGGWDSSKLCRALCCRQGTPGHREQPSLGSSQAGPQASSWGGPLATQASPVMGFAPAPSNTAQ